MAHMDTLGRLFCRRYGTMAQSDILRRFSWHSYYFIVFVRTGNRQKAAKDTIALCATIQRNLSLTVVDTTISCCVVLVLWVDVGKVMHGMRKVWAINML